MGHLKLILLMFCVVYGGCFSCVKQPGVKQGLLFYKSTQVNAIVLNISTFELLASLFTSTLQRGVYILF